MIDWNMLFLRHCAEGETPEEMLMRLNKNHSIPKLADELFLVSAPSLRNEFKRRGIPINTPKKRSKLEGIDWSQGQSPQHIARLTGVSVNRVYRYVNDNNIKTARWKVKPQRGKPYECRNAWDDPSEAVPYTLDQFKNSW